MSFPRALTIAGSDSSGGAGIQADLKTFHRFGAYGASVVTLVTSQNTQQVKSVHVLSPALIEEQCRLVLEDVGVDAIKTGALGNAEVIETVARLLHDVPNAIPVVTDPVLVSKHGAPLLDAAGLDAMRTRLFPRVTVLTPNVPEAESLLGRTIRTRAEMATAAHEIRAMGPRYVVLKGGHRAGDDASDVLAAPGGEQWFAGTRIDTRHTHGTGCTFASAIAAMLARGATVMDAVAAAKAFIASAIAGAPGIGAGHGPVNHFARAPGVPEPR